MRAFGRRRRSKSLWGLVRDLERLSRPPRQRRGGRRAGGQRFGEAGGYVYFVYDPACQAVKIGKSSDPARRIAGFQTASASKLTLLATEGPYADAYAVEGRLHRRFWRHRIRGEWFRAVPEVMAYVEEVKRSGGQPRPASSNDLVMLVVSVAALLLPVLILAATVSDAGFLQKLVGLSCMIPGFGLLALFALAEN